MPALGPCKHRVRSINLSRRLELVAADTDSGRAQSMAGDRKDAGARGPNACKREQVATILQVCGQGIVEFPVNRSDIINQYPAVPAKHARVEFPDDQRLDAVALSGI